jgi:PhzF family phenazine biosynthesis protein
LSRHHRRARSADTVVPPGAVVIGIRGVYHRWMPRLRLFQVDAFTSRRFAGNPAAVVPLATWLDDETLQAIGNENNLAETAFFVPENDAFRLRWFTPEVEVKLCGHATLASAFVLFTELEPGRQEVRYETLSGQVGVRSASDRLVLDFPRWSIDTPDEVPDALLEALNAKPLEVLSTAEGSNFLVVLGQESEVRALNPDLGLLRSLNAGVIVTAAGARCDCVCRYFAPSFGVDEDHATGSIHCALAPYWAERLRRNTVHSRQLSPRGGELFCEVIGHRVEIGGRAVKYLDGWIDI